MFTKSSFVRLMVASTLCACGDECREYSEFTCKELQRATYSVVFFFPRQDRPYDLGTASGLASCGDIAHQYAASKNLSNNRDWSYVCCLHANGSSCYEKHR